jgi:hypothetical protein
VSHRGKGAQPYGAGNHQRHAKRQHADTDHKDAADRTEGREPVIRIHHVDCALDERGGHTDAAKQRKQTTHEEMPSAGEPGPGKVPDLATATIKYVKSRMTVLITVARPGVLSASWSRWLLPDANPSPSR